MKDEPPEKLDAAWMDAALSLARRALGTAWPNPAVGCVIVRQGIAVGRGWTQPGGRPHAETEALSRAGGAAKGATAYVTLEPCAHHGRTPPCADALIEAGVSRVVAAITDPDPRVSGKGVARLRDAGIDVQLGLRQDQAAHVNAGFLRRVRDGRPTFTLKLATSLDGRIATASGDSRWITGPTARAIAHLLRARHDTVLIGSETALADDPELTCRLPGLEQASPVRIVLDGRLRLSPGSKLATGAPRPPVWVMTLDTADEVRAERLRASGAEVFPLASDGASKLSPGGIARALGDKGVTRVLIEGGGQVARAFLEADLVDEVAWFRAPVVLGDGGVPAIADLNVQAVGNGPRFARRELRTLGDDTLETFVRTR